MLPHALGGPEEGSGPLRRRSRKTFRKYYTLSGKPFFKGIKNKQPESRIIELYESYQATCSIGDSFPKSYDNSL